MFVGHGAVQHGVEHAVNRAVGADTQGQRDDDHGQKAGTLAQLPNCIANILQEPIHLKLSLLTRSAVRPWDRLAPPGVRECSWPAALQLRVLWKPPRAWPDPTSALQKAARESKLQRRSNRAGPQLC